MAKPALEGIETRTDGPADAGAIVVLGHGAGQDMDSPFMATIATAVAEAGIRVVRFNFPYMTRARTEGRKRPPDGEAVLLDTFRTVIAAQPAGCRLVVGGKSLGGRMASLIADEIGAAGLVCLGYPFHPPGRPGQLRTQHLEALRTPTLICQGARDPFGNRNEVSGYLLSRSIKLHWLEDGEHSFKPRKSSGRTETQNLREAAGTVVAFIHSLDDR
jgi:predicted alpha/beta-hydrolase family hydrolase